MKLYDLSKEAEEQHIPNVFIDYITDETDKVKPNCIFVCIKGLHFDGHNVAQEMVTKGAAVVVCEHDVGVENAIVVKDSRAYFSILASNFYNNPTKKLKLIGVTGTNGKTTITNVLQHILAYNGHKTGAIGTLCYDTCGKIYQSDLTTPRQMELYSYFAEMVENGAEYCVMEVSSLALAQHRFANETFKCSIFTNLSQDHLDYHITMDNYFKAKKLLFRMSEKAVVCIDDRYGKELVSEIHSPKKTYSIMDTADFYAVNIKCTSSCVKYWISSVTEEKSVPVTFAIPGLFSVANSMAAIAAANFEGIDLQSCAGAVADFGGVSGRCEVLYSGDFTIIRDYAHTEDALQKFLTAVKQFTPKRIICLFGAAGERDTTKRKPMGICVGKLADIAIITSDNPRFEDPELILSQVESGILDTSIPYQRIENRYEAIKAAISLAKKGDVLVLCGKGHETYQVYGNDYQPFDEKTIVRELMETSI